MNIVEYMSLIASLFFVYGCASTLKIKPGKQSARKLEKKIKKNKIKVRYLLYLPEDYIETEKKFPLILFLHGAGERGENLQKIIRHGPPKRIKNGTKFPFIIVSPQCSRKQWWSVEILDLLLTEICTQYQVDESRIYVTGLSMGGYGTWDMAIHYPDRFAAIAPICGGGDARKVKKLKKLPIWVFHGAKDAIVPLHQSEKMVAALKSVGSKVKFTVYPESEHDSWTETYENPELYEWFLNQRK